MSAAISAFLDTAPAPETKSALRASPRRLRPLNLQHVDSSQRILLDVAARYGVTLASLLAQDRHRNVARARHVAAWLMRQTGMAYPEIGKAIGNRDHTTVMASVRRVEVDLLLRPEWRASLETMLHRETPPGPLRMVAGEGMMLELEERA